MFFASCEKYDHAISDIEDRLDKIEGTSLTTIDQQITAINGSIDDLKGVDAELKGYIKSLQTTAADLQSPTLLLQHWRATSSVRLQRPSRRCWASSIQ